MPEEDLPILSNIHRFEQSSDFVYIVGKISESADSSAHFAKRIGLVTGVCLLVFLANRQLFMLYIHNAYIFMLIRIFGDCHTSLCAE
jgi:hypothetical protein